MESKIGTIIYWNPVRKWGFIDVDNDDHNILFHAEGPFNRGDRVEFNQLPVGAKGPMAVDITIVE